MSALSLASERVAAAKSRVNSIKSGMDILYMVYATAQMMFWPKILGGTPIAFSRTEVRPSKEWLQKLADLAEQGMISRTAMPTETLLLS